MNLDVYALLRVALRHDRAGEVASYLLDVARESASDAAEYVNASAAITRTLRQAYADAATEERRRYLNGEDEDEAGDVSD